MTLVSSTVSAELDSDEAALRGRERQRRALLTSLTNVGAKVVTVATSFATVPLTMHYLGDERFGLWMTISSFSALLAFADLGLGNGLLNAVAEASGRNDQTAIRRAVANATAMLGSVALLVLLAMIPALYLVDWAGVFGLKDPRSLAEIRPALMAFAVCFALNIATGVIQRVQLGLQMGFLNGLSNAAGAVLGLVAVLGVIRVNGGLPWLIVALLGGPLMAMLASGVWFFVRLRPQLVPRWSDVDAASMHRLARLGGLFFVLQLTSSLAYSTDNTIAARFAGAAAVGDYAVAARLFSAVTIIASIFLNPLWPAYGEALARRDGAWAQRILVRSTSLVTVGSLAACAVLLAAFDLITQLWLHRELHVGWPLLFGIAAWTVLGNAGSSIAMFLNGAHVVRMQVIVSVLCAGLCVAGKVLAMPAVGLAGLPWTTVVVYLATTVIPYALLLPPLLRRLRQGQDFPASSRPS